MPLAFTSKSCAGSVTELVTATCAARDRRCIASGALHGARVADVATHYLQLIAAQQRAQPMEIVLHASARKIIEDSNLRTRNREQALGQI